jgi:hypothetical protein
MFIYKSEKEEMQRSITYLLGEFSKLWSEYLFLKAKIKVLEDKSAPKPPKKKTEEQLKVELKKARQRVYARNYYQRKKEREQVLNVGS